MSHDVPSTSRKKPTVTILGAGVAGLTAAHELMDRGYDVDVYEQAAWPGGKAATQYPWLNFGDEKKPEWVQVPAEHGFRLFPSFYNHLTDTLGRIPFRRYATPSLGTRPLGASESRNTGTRPDRVPDTVLENLLSTSAASTVRRDMKPQVIPRAYGDKLGDFLRALENISGTMHLSEANTSDTQRFQLKCLQFITSCHKRRDQLGDHSYGGLTWWEFLGGEWFSPRFQVEIETFIRTMVAMNARTGNARTVGNVGMQLIFDLATDGSKVDRVLNGPSSDHWLFPWEAHLRAGGVRFHYGCTVRRLLFDRASRRITRIELERGDEVKTVEVDRKNGHVIAALPLEAMRRILSRRASESLVQEDAGLKWIHSADLDRFTAWMTGIQFYLEHDVPIVRGHVYYPDTPWKLSSVSQAQFWGSDFHRVHGQNRFRGILSVDICDWHATPGAHEANGKLACDAGSAQKVADEVWSQLRDSLTYQGRSSLPEKPLGFHLDDNIRFADEATTERWKADPKANPTRAINTSPYFIHPAGSHHERPTAKTLLPNLYLAGDYVRTHTDLATMEGANESARRAVNAILEADGVDGDLCRLYEFSEPAEFEYAKKLDEDLFHRGEPHLFESMGLFEHFERGMSSGLPGVMRAATSAIQPPRLFRAGMPNLISRIW